MFHWFCLGGMAVVCKGVDGRVNWSVFSLIGGVIVTEGLVGGSCFFQGGSGQQQRIGMVGIGIIWRRSGERGQIVSPQERDFVRWNPGSKGLRKRTPPRLDPELKFSLKMVSRP